MSKMDERAIKTSYAVKFLESLIYMLIAAYSNFSLFRLSLKTIDKLGMVTVAFILTTTGILFTILYIQLGRKVLQRYIEMRYWDVSFDSLKDGIRFLENEPQIKFKYIAILKTDRIYWIAMTFTSILCAIGVSLYWRNEMRVVMLPIFCAMSICFAMNWYIACFDIDTANRRLGF